jgi:NTP pyrophosphatase (non-canonical NTP hydrolase)
MLKEIAIQANQIEDEIGLDLDAVMHKFTQEVGELNDAIQKYRGIYCKTRMELPDVEKEAGDVLFNFISLLNKLGIDPDKLPEFAQTTLEKFKERKDIYMNNLQETRKD